MKWDVVIVGAGHGGAACASKLRQAKFSGTILVIGAEPDLPYERPPLSKSYLAQEKSFDRILIRPATFWQQNNIEFKLGTSVLAVDADRRRVTTSAGEVIDYGDLVWATGGAPRRLSCDGGDLGGVHTVRTRLDADRMMGELDHVDRAVVIGGGYIGLEAAAVLRKFGKNVILLEAQDRVLARVAGEHLSRFFEDEHRKHGVDIRLGQSVNCILGEESAEGVRLQCGAEIAAQMVIVGIGIIPAVEQLAASGAEARNGVLVDAACRTSLPHVYAIGDCALHHNKFSAGGPVRIESVQNAVDQAGVAAKVISGREATYEVMPWFWSDQYDLKLQTAGLSAGHDTAILRGDPRTRSFSVGYFKDDQLMALDAVNNPADFVQSRLLITSQSQIDAEQFADAGVALKDLAR